jgi:VWFA-related protein
MVRNRLVPFLLASFIATVVAAQGGKGAPPPQESEEPTFFESIDVQVVNVEVFVTDRAGKRVTGLTREDFEILEDRQPIEVSNFYAVDAGKAQIGSGPVDPGEGSLIDEPAPAEEGTPSEQRLHLAIVLDDLTMTPQNRNRLVQAIETSVLPRLQPDDRAMVAILNGGSVQITQGLTADRTLLQKTLDEAMKSSSQGIARVSELRNLLALVEGTGLGGSEQQAGLNAAAAEEAYHGIRAYSQQRLMQSRASLSSLASFIESLSGLPGRKAVLFVSSGLSARPGQAIFDAWMTKFGRQMSGGVGASGFDGMREDLTQDIAVLVEHANANRVTFYTLGATDEVTGLSAEFASNSSFGRDLATLEQMNVNQSLDFLAGGTGGLSGINLFNPGNMLDRMHQDFDSYYSIGYVPAQRRDGKNRKIEIRIRGRNDLTVRHREGRRDQTNKERMTDRTLAALLLDPGANPLEAAIDFVDEKKERDHYKVEVLVKFPLGKLVLLPKERFHEGRVTVFVGARDERGRISPIQEIDVPIRVPNDQLLTALGQTAAYKATLLLRPQPHTVAVAVRDELGNVDSSLATSFTPGSLPETRR